MSPPLVDARSPATSSKPSFPQYPNPTFPSFSNDHQQTLKASPLAASGTHNGQRLGPGRARPRLVKVRRQYVSGDFNPFSSFTENRDCCSSSGGGSNGLLGKFGADGNGVSKMEFVRGDKELNSNEGFVFGLAKERELSGNEGERSVFKAQSGQVDDVGFVFGATGSACGVKLDLKKRESSDCGVNEGSLDLGEVTLLSGEGSHKEGSVGNESGAVWRDLGLNLNFEKGEVSENMTKLGSGNVNFEFGANHDYSRAHVGISGSNFVFGATHCDSSTTLVGSGSGFVFGASWFSSMLDLSVDKRESDGSLSDDMGKVKEESEDSKKLGSNAVKSEINATMISKDDNKEGAFVFGSSSKKSSSVNEYVAANCPSDLKSSDERFENCNNMVKAENCSLDSTFNDECKLASFQDSSNVSSDHSIKSMFCLPHEMMKLNIDDFKNLEVDNKKSSSYDPFSAFRSRKGASTTPNENSDTTSHENDAAKALDGATYECSGKEKLFNMSSASIGIPSSELFIFKEGVPSSFEGQKSSGQLNDDVQLNRPSALSSSSSVGLDSQVNNGVCEAPPMAGVGKENHKRCTTVSPGRLVVPFMDFQMPWDPACLKTSLFPELNKKPEAGANTRSRKGKRSETMRGKTKQRSVHKQRHLQDNVLNESNAKENLNSPGGYSPMDFSPYEETTAAEQFPGETSLTSHHFNHPDNSCVPSTLPSMGDTGIKDCGNEGLHINEDEKKPRDPNADSYGYHSGRSFTSDRPSKGFIFGADTGCSGVKIDQVCRNGESGIAAAEAVCHLKTEGNHPMQFCFTSGLEAVDGRSFSLSASTSQSSLTAKRQNRKKNRRKLPCKPFIIASSPNGQGAGLSASQRTVGNEPETNEQVEQGPFSSSLVIQQACEMWRSRGNQAYQNGDLSKAENFYTHGINSIPSHATPGCYLKPLVICYSNRAATRMSLGKLRQALCDCVMAASLDPNFFKALIRAANCHLLLGEIENAKHYFSQCLESGAGVCLDRRMTIEAADGLQKAQRVAECVDLCAKCLEQRTSDEALITLNAIDEALSISPYSERLLEMKAEILLVLRKYKEVIQLCEQTLSAAEKNFASVGADGQLVDSGENNAFARMWRWHLISKSNFYLGKLEVALDLLQKLEQMGSVSYKHVSKILESSVTLAVAIRNLIRHKSAGNEAVRSGRYTEALEHYTAALSSTVDSRPFAAICFGNRAAAHQALCQITEAIADCSLAIALDGNYSKAVSRRAALHEMIRDYGQAARDLQKLILILEHQSDEKAKQIGTPSRTASRTKDLRQARRRLPLMEEEAKKGIPLDFYRILGIKDSDTALDIKKAYRKAALRHHPDKAAQFLVKSETGDEGKLWKEIIQEVHIDADRLFKMIGEAYAVLSDTRKRSEYDFDEEIRKASNKNKAYSPCRRSSGDHGYPHQSNHQKDRQDNWRTYGYSRSRW